MNDDANENAANYKINNEQATTGKSFEHKPIIIGSTTNDNNTLDTKVVVPFKIFEKFLKVSRYAFH